MILFLIVIISPLALAQEDDLNLNSTISTDSNSEIGIEEARAALLIARRDRDEMQSLGYPTQYLEDLLFEAEAAFEGRETGDVEKEIRALNESNRIYQARQIYVQLESSVSEGRKYGQNFSLVISTVDEIKEWKQRVYNVDDQIKLLQSRIDEMGSDYNMDSAQIMLDETKEMFSEQRISDAEEELPLVAKRIEDLRFEQSSLQILAEASSRTFVAFVKRNWVLSIIVSILLIVGLALLYNYIMILNSIRKIDEMKTEMKVIKDLKKRAQEDYYKKRVIAKSTYDANMRKYGERELEIKEEIPVLEDTISERKKLHFGPFMKKEKAKFKKRK